MTLSDYIIGGLVVSLPLVIVGVVGLWLQARSMRGHVEKVTSEQTTQIQQALDQQTREIKGEGER